MFCVFFLCSSHHVNPLSTAVPTTTAQTGANTPQHNNQQVFSSFTFSAKPTLTESIVENNSKSGSVKPAVGISSTNSTTEVTQSVPVKSSSSGVLNSNVSKETTSEPVSSSSDIVSGFGSAQTFEFILDDVSIPSLSTRSDSNVQTADIPVTSAENISDTGFTSHNLNDGVVKDTGSNSAGVVHNESFADLGSSSLDFNADHGSENNVSKSENHPSDVTLNVHRPALWNAPQKPFSQSLLTDQNKSRDSSGQSSSVEPCTAPGTEKKKKTIMELPLPPGEVINSEQMIIEKRGGGEVDRSHSGSKTAIPCLQTSSATTLSSLRKDFDSDEELPEELINEIVLKNPIGAKKSREVHCSVSVS